MDRRSILGLSFAAVIDKALPQMAPGGNSTSKSILSAGAVPTVGSLSLPIAVVTAGKDRAGRTHQIGVSATTYKVVTSESKGDLFVIEQANTHRGGPPLHVHHGEDELFYALEGEYLVQVGNKQFPLKAGDCVLGPRGVPHAWAFVGATVGRLLLSYAPAGKMEAFFDAWEQLGFSPAGYSKEKDAALLRAYGMERVGPPIQL